MIGPLAAERLRRAYVLGLGVSGIAAVRLLQARGVEVVASDRRTASELELDGLEGLAGVELHTGTDRDALDAGIDVLVLSPGVAPGHPLVAEARRAGVPVLGEVELAFAYLDGTVVAVTGSNGKSTTTALAGALIAAAGRTVEVCGNIGVPLSSVVEGAPGRVFVVELSSFQLESVHRFRPRAAALLNLSPDHLDRHGDLTGYLEAKRRIFARQGAEDVAVLNADDPEVAGTAVAARRRAFSLRGAVEDGAFVAGEQVIERQPGAADRELFALSDLPLAGPHNLENALAAALLARAVEIEPGVLPAALRGFRGLPHRLERVAERAGVSFWNDSKGTNVGATLRSIEGFPDGSLHLVLGGRNKGADLGLLRVAVARKARRVYLIGEAAGELERALTGAVEISRSETLEAAVAESAERARPGEAVVLSPACASFDQFRDFRDRGERFVRLVSALAAEPVGGGR